jgi:hypothetical protein
VATTKKPIRIKPANRGKLHKKMGVPKGEKLPTAAIAKKKAAAKKSGDTATVKQTTFALNARKWAKKKPKR